jgi:hypothetical protein
MSNSNTRGGAQLFCLVVGATLILAGILGFFYEGAFSSDESVREPVLGILDVNGWHNLVHLATGGLTLAFGLSDEARARTWALVFGVVYLAVAIWGFAIGSGESILSIIPVNTEDNILHVILALAGLATYALTAPKADRRTASPAT